VAGLRQESSRVVQIIDVEAKVSGRCRIRRSAEEVQFLAWAGLKPDQLRVGKRFGRREFGQAEQITVEMPDEGLVSLPEWR
jgi:hypothetical protein